MTFLAVPISVRQPDDLPQAKQRAELAIAAGARLIEWRVDGLAMHDGAQATIERLVRESDAPCILTIRSVAEGGEFDGAEADRFALCAQLLRGDHPPRYVDIELQAWSAETAGRHLVEQALDSQPAHRRTSLILSAHDFSRRPADLLQRIERMAAEPHCDVIKIAWMARSLRDNLEAFDLLQQRPKPMIALCMGRFGLMSRVLAPKFGAMLTFASDDPLLATAPGQPTIDDLLKLYRFTEMSSATQVYGVIGWPVEHSIGPRVHNAGFAKVTHNGVYLPLPIPPEYEHFKATLATLLDHDALQFRGASVTIPHKQHLVRFVREQGGKVDLLAAQIGAANTLVVDQDRTLRCQNTDAPAIVDVLCESLAIEHDGLRGMKIALMGAGGVARAAAVACAIHGADVIIFNRTQANAHTLVQELTQLSLPGRIVAGKPGRIGCGCFPVLINCTALGMEGGPAPDQSPLDVLGCDEGNALGPDVTVFDTVYAPLRTPLIQQAEQAGARTITGDRMFARQAALQFQAWTGHLLPTDVV